jgi:hypothetical protein
VFELQYDRDSQLGGEWVHHGGGRGDPVMAVDGCALLHGKG